jgi:hypothetical protein
MAIDFPAPATLDQEFTDATSGKSWKFDGTAWKIKPEDAAVTPPTSYVFNTGLTLQPDGVTVDLDPATPTIIGGVKLTSGRINLGIGNSFRFAQIPSGPCLLKGVIQKIYGSAMVTAPFEFFCSDGATAGDGTYAGSWYLFALGEFRKGSALYHLNPKFAFYRNGAVAEVVFSSGNNGTDIWLTYSVMAGNPIIASGPVAGTRILELDIPGSGGPPALSGITG